MAYVIYYRKPKFHKNYPWIHNVNNHTEVISFIKDLGDEYDFRIFEEITLADLYEMELLDD